MWDNKRVQYAIDITLMYLCKASMARQELEPSVDRDSTHCYPALEEIVIAYCPAAFVRWLGAHPRLRVLELQ